MNWDRIQGNGKQLKGNVKHRWGRLINDQFLAMEGKRDLLAGLIQEANGLSMEVAEKQNAAMAKVSER